MVNAQEWLDKNYPKEERGEIKELDISVRKLLLFRLEGSLNFEGFINLERLICWGNKLTSLDLSMCVNLKELNFSYNRISQLDLNNNHALDLERVFLFGNPLTSLDLRNNNIININDKGFVKYLYGKMDIKMPIAIPKEKLESIIRNKIDISGEIKLIDIFPTWWNPNCAIVVNEVVSLSKLISLPLSLVWVPYVVRIVIYEPPFEKVEEILESFKITKYPNLAEVKIKVEKLKKKWIVKNQHRLSLQWNMASFCMTLLKKFHYHMISTLMNI
jgi:hypothetical protein